MFMRMTKYLYVSKYELNGHVPQDGIINVYPGENIVWTTGILCPNNFVIDSYQFTEFIFYIDYTELHLLKNWNLTAKYSHVIVRHCDEPIDALDYLFTDVMLNIHVYFSEDIEQQLQHLEKF